MAEWKDAAFQVLLLDILDLQKTRVRRTMF
jgi:hypothetical protein